MDVELQQRAVEYMSLERKPDLARSNVIAMPPWEKRKSLLLRRMAQREVSPSLYCLILLSSGCPPCVPRNFILVPAPAPLGPAQGGGPHSRCRRNFFSHREPCFLFFLCSACAMLPSRERV